MAQRNNAIVAYTDGASSGRSAGIGVVLVVGGYRREISEAIGESTSDIAALRAILRALESIRARDRPVVVHSESAYAIGVLAQGWPIRAHHGLIAEIRALAATFAQLTFACHAGVGESERCDRLAREAIESAGHPRDRRATLGG